jgi:hypothetical protein
MRIMSTGELIQTRTTLLAFQASRPNRVMTAIACIVATYFTETDFSFSLLRPEQTQRAVRLNKKESSSTFSSFLPYFVP